HVVYIPTLKLLASFPTAHQDYHDKYKNCFSIETTSSRSILFSQDKQTCK
ncbi:MAG: hypothetical protein ACI8RD_014580, partial [Bacillariaceae sp.]